MLICLMSIVANCFLCWGGVRGKILYLPFPCLSLYFLTVLTRIEKFRFSLSLTGWHELFAGSEILPLGRGNREEELVA